MKQVQKTKQKTRTEDSHTDETTGHVTETPAADSTDEVLASIDEALEAQDVDELLDEIDDVLEVNAEEFVQQYVQQGGE